METRKVKSVLVILRRIYLDLTGNHCAAKLIEYFKHWREWKLKNHRTDWVYMPLKRIHEDLMGEHSLHVIRRAIALLEEKGFLRRRNNPSNGQDKTYQYQLQVEAIESMLSERCKSEAEVPKRGNEPSEFNVEQHPQDTSTDIKNTNITPIEEVSKEEILGKYEQQLKLYGIYTHTWQDDKLVDNPKLKPTLAALARIPRRRAERVIQAFLKWIRTAKNVEDRYKAMEVAISKGWE